MGRGEFVAALGTDIAGDGSNRSVSYHWVQWQHRAEVRCCYDQQDAKPSDTARHHKRAFYGNLKSSDRRLVATRRAAIHLIGYDAVGVGYGFGDLLTSQPESIPPERTIPFAAGTLPSSVAKKLRKSSTTSLSNSPSECAKDWPSPAKGATTDDGLDFGIQLNLEAEARRQLGQRRFEINEQTNKIRLQPKNKLKESPDQVSTRCSIAGISRCVWPCAAQVCPGRCTSAGSLANDRGRTHTPAPGRADQSQAAQS